jgi:hypothetical protein
MTPTGRPVHLPGAGVVYVEDPQQFSIELLWMASWAEKLLGMRQKPLSNRASR